MSSALYYFFYYTVSALATYYYCSHAFPKDYKFSHKKTISAYIIAFMSLYLLSFVHNSFLNIFSFLIANFLLIIYVYKLKITTVLFHDSLLTMFMIIGEILPDAIIISLFSRESLYSTYTVADMRDPIIFAYAILCKSVYFLFVFFATQFFTGKDNSKTLLEKKSNIIIAIPVLAIIILLTIYYFLTKESPSRIERILIVSSLLCLLIINIISIWLYEYIKKQQIKLIKMAQNRQLQQDTEQYNRLLSTQDEGQKMLIHDIKNHLYTIYDLCKNKDAAGAASYLDSLFEFPALQKTVTFSDNVQLNLLLTRYTDLYKEGNVKFDIDVQNSDLDFMQPDDITSLICNMLDNAYEAARTQKDGAVSIRISDSKTASASVISVTNSCREAPHVKKNSIFATTKSDKTMHGFGTRIMSYVAEKYNGHIETYFDDNDRSFHAIVLLHKDYNEKVHKERVI